MRKLKPLNICLLSVLIIFVLGNGTALAKRHNFSFANYCGRSVVLLYINASSANTWGSDILGRGNILANGDSFGCWYNDKYRYFDVKVVFADGSDAVFSRYDFKNLWRLTLYKKGNTYYIKGN